MQRYYSILGIPPGASKEEIKKAYRKKAMQYHPDRNRDRNAREKFLEILEAYEFLIGGGATTRKKAPAEGQNAEQSFEDIMRDLAKKRAKEKYRERVREFRRRQAEEQNKEFIKAIYVLVSIIVLAGSVYLGNKLYNYLMVLSDPVERMASVYSISPRHVHIRYTHNDTLYLQSLYVSKTRDEMKGTTGMPLFKGDKFVVRFNASNPNHFMLFFNRVSPKTLQRYLGLATFRLIEIYEREWSMLNFDEKKYLASCVAGEIYRKFGLEGLSQVYYFDTFLLENTKHNSLSWFFFKQNGEYKQLLEHCTKNQMLP
jgi:hypothetical protein